MNEITRLSYIDKDLADSMPDFMIGKQEAINTFVKTRVKDFSLINMMKVLFVLRNRGTVGFSEFFEASGIRMKKSFLNYLDLLMEYQLIFKHVIAVTKSGRICEADYMLSDKGIMFLDMFLTKRSIEIEPLRK